MDTGGKPSPVEGIKAASDYLRGSLIESLEDGATGAIAEDDTQISKFHGVYQQDDRDQRRERAARFLEPAYQFMIRTRIPGGLCTPEQWLALDRLAVRYANGSIRLTVRQSVQFHGVIKGRLKPTITAINRSLLDTLAACGDVNRNVMCHANPALSPVHHEVLGWARRLSTRLTPQTHAYHEIWLDGEKHVDSREDTEPLYGSTYLPRKFKIGLAVPPDNDVDVFSQDLGLVAIVEGGVLLGFDVLVGGGMGMSHGNASTWPQLAEAIGFCKPDQIIALAEAVVAIQRDYGDRSNRLHARLKYTLADRGMPWFRQQLRESTGFDLAPLREFRFTHNGDALGWRQAEDHRWHLTIPVENGRVVNRGKHRLRSALRRIAQLHRGDFHFTPNQNLIVAGVHRADRERLDSLLAKYGVAAPGSALRQHAMACVGLPSCGLAMAESERYLPDFVTRLDEVLARHQVSGVPITLRMTGCPNGCARPYLAEIALVGKAPGRYKLFLGGSARGDRLARLLVDNADEETVLATLEPLIAAFAKDRRAEERFADFLIRRGLLRAAECPEDFHQAARPT